MANGEKSPLNEVQKEDLNLKPTFSSFSSNSSIDLEDLEQNSPQYKDMVESPLI